MAIIEKWEKKELEDRIRAAGGAREYQRRADLDSFPFDESEQKQVEWLRAHPVLVRFLSGQPDEEEQKPQPQQAKQQQNSSKTAVPRQQNSSKTAVQRPKGTIPGLGSSIYFPTGLPQASTAPSPPQRGSIPGLGSSEYFPAQGPSSPSYPSPSSSSIGAPGRGGPSARAGTRPQSSPQPGMPDFSASMPRADINRNLNAGAQSATGMMPPGMQMGPTANIRDSPHLNPWAPMGPPPQPGGIDPQTLELWQWMRR